MKKIALISLVGGCVLATAALADAPPAGSVSMATVLQNLNAKGYTVVRDVEFEHGKYEAKAFNPQGHEVKLAIDPKTGNVMESRKGSDMTVAEALKKVEAAGYKDIYEFKSEEDKYEFKGFNKDGKKVELKVKFDTGVVSE